MPEDIARRRDDDDRAPDLPAEIGELVGRLSGEEEMDRETRGRLLRRLARLLTASAHRARSVGIGGGRWLAEIVIEVAPHVPVRDLETLRRHHHELQGEQLADSLVKAAANATTTVGAAGGALAAVQFVAPPLLLTAPAQLVAETVVVAALEVKLIAELHEVYGVQVPGNGAQRATVFLQAWTRRRGVDPWNPASLTLALGVAARQALRKRLLRTLGRHLTTLGPFLTGAVAGGSLNRLATKRLADGIRADLRRVIGSTPPRKAID
ncbi:MAG TPA: hypothetical protein VH912_01825 [Streptosporangiaceae bacterium]